MVNFNGAILETASNFLNENQRGLRFGDILFEELRVMNGNLVFWEEHYFRLMASMRILRMEIPTVFTMEYLESEILKTIEQNDVLNNSALITFAVFRNFSQSLLPKTNQVSWFISCQALTSSFYTIDEEPYEVELFKDFLVNQDMLTNLNTNNKTIAVTASIFAEENGYADSIVLNTSKHVVGTTQGAIFLAKDKVIKTPPLSSGVKNEVIRTKIIEIIERSEDITLIEEAISPFELQKADELFAVNIALGIVPISKYRKKTYQNEMGRKILGKLNAQARMTSLK